MRIVQHIIFWVCIIILIIPFCALSQDNEPNSVANQIWLDYNPTIPLTERVDFYGDAAARTVFPNEWYRFVIGPSLRYKQPKSILKKLYYKEEFHFGIRFFYTVNKNFSNRLEIRPFQGYRLIWPNRPQIAIQHYVRLEERFDIQTSDWISTFGLRIRYMIESKLISYKNGLYLPLSLELFWNIKGTKQFNDVARVTPGIGYEFKKSWKGQFDLSYHYARNTLEDDFANNNIVFRFRVYHTLQFKNKDSYE